MTSLIIKGVIGLVIVAALVYAWHLFVEHYREQGRVEVHALLDPQLEQQTKRAEAALEANKQLVADLAELGRKVDAANAALDAMKVKALAAEVAARKAMLAAAESAKKYTSEIARLTAIAGGPTLTRDTCAEADAILRKLALDRQEVVQ